MAVSLTESDSLKDSFISLESSISCGYKEQFNPTKIEFFGPKDKSFKKKKKNSGR